MSSAGLFSSETYREVRRPLPEASTLPPDCYTSDAFYRREIEYLFRKHWQFVGRAEQLAGPVDKVAHHEDRPELVRVPEQLKVAVLVALVLLRD